MLKIATSKKQICVLLQNGILCLNRTRAEHRLNIFMKYCGPGIKFLYWRTNKKLKSKFEVIGTVFVGLGHWDKHLQV